jgi:hypothetical protein
MQTRTVLAILIVLVISVTSGASAQSPEQVCAKGTWTNCGLAIKQEMDKGGVTPDRAVQLVTAWDGAYRRQLDHLRQQKMLVKAKSDYELIQEAVLDELNPVSIGLDKAKDALLKRYLPRVATFMIKAAPVLGGLQVFFTPSQTATDFDQLQLMNKDLIDRVHKILEPLMVKDWKQRYDSAIKAAAPAFRAKG